MVFKSVSPLISILVATIPNFLLSSRRWRLMPSVSTRAVKRFWWRPSPMLALPASVLSIPLTEMSLSAPPISPRKFMLPARTSSLGIWMFFPWRFFSRNSIVWALSCSGSMLANQRLLFDMLPFALSFSSPSSDSTFNWWTYSMLPVPEKSLWRWSGYSKVLNWRSRKARSDGVIWDSFNLPAYFRVAISIFPLRIS